MAATTLLKFDGGYHIPQVDNIAQIDGGHIIAQI